MPFYFGKYYFEDDDQRTTTREVLYESADEAAVLAAMAAHLPDIQAMTNLGVVKYSYTRVVNVNEAPAAGSNIDPGATFLWETALNIDPTNQIPDPVDSIKNGEGGIDLTNATVIAWADNWLSGEARLNRNVFTQPTALKKGTLDK